MPGGVAMQGSSADTGLVAVSEDAVSGSWDGSVAVMPKVAVLLCTWFTGGEACGSIAMGGAPCSVCNDVSSNSTGAAGDAAAGSDNGGAVSGEGGRALSMTFSPETASSWTGEKASVPGGVAVRSWEDPVAVMSNMLVPPQSWCQGTHNHSAVRGACEMGVLLDDGGRIVQQMQKDTGALVRVNGSVGVLRAHGSKDQVAAAALGKAQQSASVALGEERQVCFCQGVSKNTSGSCCILAILDAASGTTSHCALNTAWVSNRLPLLL